MTRRTRATAAKLQSTTASPHVDAAEQTAAAHATPPADTPAATPEPMISMPVSLAVAARDIIGQIPSGQVADFYLPFRNYVNAQIAHLQAKAG